MKIMDYHSRYGLEFNPFIKNAREECLVETNECKEVNARLKYLLNNKGFGLITGGPGRGKTTIIRNWSRSLNTQLYKVVYLSLSTITVIEFYRQLAFGLGIEPAFRKSDNFKMIQEVIQRYEIEKKRTPVIILDEANYMHNSILNDIKMIFNFDMDARDRAIVMFVGLPVMTNTLRLNIHEPLRQRITMNYQLEGLRKNETKQYINKKLQSAKCQLEIFNEEAIEAIANAANGVARVV